MSQISLLYIKCRKCSENAESRFFLFLFIFLRKVLDKIFKVQSDINSLTLRHKIRSKSHRYFLNKNPHF